MKTDRALTDTTGHSGGTPPHRQAIPLGTRFREMLPLTFRGQAMLFLVPTIIIMSMVYTIESISTERRILRSEIVKKGETIAAIAARNAEIPVLSENIELLKSTSLALMDIKDVAYVSFFNNRLESMFHEGKTLPSPSAPVFETVHEPVVRSAEYREVFEFVAPVFTLKAQEELFLFEEKGAPPPVREQIGWVRLGLSKDVMARTERGIILRSSVLAVVFTGAGIVLLYLFVSLATRPLLTLISAVQEIREGEHPEVPVVEPKSEVGRLTSEFNRMSRAIRERETALQANVQELKLQIDAREAVEEELRKHQDHLEDLVDERTAQLTIAKEQAETASRAKSDFLSSMSHELRTPLNAILGYAQILRRQENLTAAQRQQLEIMHSSGEHLLMLINDILDVGKIEARKMEIASVPFDLPALLRQVFNLTRLHAEEKELSFRYEAGNDMPHYVLGDERKVRQILLNLLSNAVKYTHRGGVALRVRYDHAGGGVLRCEVSDTGIGIPADKLEAVFEPFTQLAANRQVREGTGLGLNITRHLLMLMAGRIGVESVLGSGSTFWLELPLPPVTELDIAVERKQQNIVGYQGERRSILVVDDNVNNTSMLVSLLEPLGFAVSTAENGRAALQCLAELTPDLVILDMVMPEMDGLEAAEAMRRIPKLTGMKIIGASATVSESARKEEFAALCDAFVTKPIQIDLLLERIKGQLGIEWNRTAAGSCAVAGADGLEAEFEVPTPARLRSVYELALLGDMRRIQAWAAQLEDDDSHYTPFAARLRELAGAYRTKAILALLDEHLGDTDEC